MSFAAKGPLPGVENGPLELSGYGGVDLQANIPNQAPSQAQNQRIARLRRQRLVERLHRLGPAPLGHFIREVEGATGADLTARAFAVLDAWGFKQKTILTWAKDRMGTGDWLRGQTEHCLMAVRGKPVVRKYASAGIAVIPCEPASKEPVWSLVPKDLGPDRKPVPRSGGVRKATRDPATISPTARRSPSASTTIHPS